MLQHIFTLLRSGRWTGEGETNILKEEKILGDLRRGGSPNRPSSRVGGEPHGRRERGHHREGRGYTSHKSPHIKKRVCTPCAGFPVLGEESESSTPRNIPQPPISVLYPWLDFVSDSIPRSPVTRTGGSETTLGKDPNLDGKGPFFTAEGLGGHPGHHTTTQTYKICFHEQERETFDVNCT